MEVHKNIEIWSRNVLDTEKMFLRMFLSKMSEDPAFKDNPEEALFLAMEEGQKKFMEDVLGTTLAEKIWKSKKKTFFPNNLRNFTSFFP